MKSRYYKYIFDCMYHLQESLLTAKSPFCRPRRVQNSIFECQIHIFYKQDINYG
jgi:CRISPR/Cas system-associated endoribonuclease Cas2